MSAAEQRAWLETPTGQFQQRMGMTVTTDHAAVERHVEEIRGIYRERFGRELREDELAAVRKGGELRSQVATGGRVFTSAHELAQIMGWGVLMPPKDRGMAKLVDGHWEGDPAIVAAAEKADADFAARNAQGFTNIGQLGIAGPT